MEQRFAGKKVIVTGGAGFIGSHLADVLIKEGASVVVIDNLSSGDKENINEAAKWYNLDFRDFNSLDYTFQKEKPEYVFHVGAWGRMPMCLNDPIGAYENNVIGSLNVLEASRRANTKKVVLSSSCIIYCQDTPYKGSKIAMEHLGIIYRHSYNLPNVCLRYANVYGTRQNIEKDSAMFAALRKAYNENGKVQIFGDGEQTRDWIHVSDVVEANLHFALNEFQGGIDIATGRSVSLNYIVKELLKVPYEHVEERKGDEKHIGLDNISAKMIGFEAKVKLEDGIKEIW